MNDKKEKQTNKEEQVILRNCEWEWLLLPWESILPAVWGWRANQGGFQQMLSSGRQQVEKASRAIWAPSTACQHMHPCRWVTHSPLTQFLSWDLNTHLGPHMQVSHSSFVWIKTFTKAQEVNKTHLRKALKLTWSTGCSPKLYSHHCCSVESFPQPSTLQVTQELGGGDFQACSCLWVIPVPVSYPVYHTPVSGPDTLTRWLS